MPSIANMIYICFVLCLCLHFMHVYVYGNCATSRNYNATHCKDKISLSPMIMHKQNILQQWRSPFTPTNTPSLPIKYSSFALQGLTIILPCPKSLFYIQLRGSMPEPLFLDWFGLVSPFQNRISSKSCMRHLPYHDSSTLLSNPTPVA